MKLLEALQTPGSPQLDYAREVAPWLGPHAGVFLASLQGAGPIVTLLQQGLLGGSSGGAAGSPFAAGVDGAIVMDTSDPSKARSFLTTQANHAGAHAATYRGVSYETTSAGLAFGLVDRFAVIGSREGLRAVIDTTQGGGALSSAGAYAKLLAHAPSEALAHVYVNPQARPASSAAGAALGGTGALALLGGSHPANVSLIARSGSLALDVDTLSSGTGAGGLLSASPEASAALSSLPSESWLAIGLPRTGDALPGDIAGLRALTSLLSTGPEASSSVQSLVAGLLAPLEVLGAPSAAARAAFGRWMGAAGVFASGSSLLELRAAVVIDSTDAAASRAAVAKLGQALHAKGGSAQPVSLPGTEAALSATVKGLPLKLYVAAGRDAAGQPKFVLGLGEASVAAALTPSSTLSGSTTRTAGAASIGEGAAPSVLLDFPTLLGLLEGVGLTESPSLAPVVPYLRSVTTLAGGGHALSGEVERFRLVLGLAPSGG